MYTSLHQRHRQSDINKKQLFKVCNTWPYVSTWQQRFSHTNVPRVIIFVLFFFLHHCIISENTPTLQNHFCRFVWTHFFRQRQNEPQQTEPAVIKSTTKQCWKVTVEKKSMLTIENLAVNWRFLRGRSWAWNKVARIYPSHIKTCDNKTLFLSTIRANQHCLYKYSKVL